MARATVGRRTRPTERSVVSEPAVSQQLLALQLVQPTPDAMWLADPDGVLQTGLADRTGHTDGLGPSLAFELLVLALEMRRREEHDRLWPPTCRLDLPGVVDANSAHPKRPPFARATLQPRFSSRQGLTFASRTPKPAGQGAFGGVRSR